LETKCSWDEWIKVCTASCKHTPSLRTPPESGESSDKIRRGHFPFINAEVLGPGDIGQRLIVGITKADRAMVVICRWVIYLPITGCGTI